ncbi:MAG TPA: peptidoglycan DD-metalloendopeptidase family protein, partial [Pseudomonadaceae bacterium]|nr:peptidoglycan DD-metalloendopeptidase family protein [Pseudomonadaceae bacterium]
MKIIICDENHGATRAVVLKGWMRAALGFCLLGLPVLLGYYGYQLADTRSVRIAKDEASQAWAQGLKEQKADLERVKQEALNQLQTLTIRMANLQARLIRLDALGARLTNATGLDDGEFNFDSVPSIGGPEIPLGSGLQLPDFVSELDALARQIESRQQQLNLLDTIIIEREADSEFQVSGRPVKKGYISSGFGRRIDPFTGNVALHQGVDFATGQIGEEVFAVAAGVITWAGERSGYGKMVRVNHGNGYETLYAHDDQILVKVGDVVKKGQLIALSGTTGRSTGPHVHFEVHKNGR